MRCINFASIKIKDESKNASETVMVNNTMHIQSFFPFQQEII